MVVSTYHTNTMTFNDAQTVKLDLASAEMIHDVLEGVDPDVVVHSAAITDVDACETYPEIAHRINVEGSKKLATIAADYADHFTYVSTDAVYGGEGQFHSEDDPLVPLNVYTETKIKGEAAVQRSHSNVLVIRTAFHGLSPVDRQSLSEWILSNLLDGESLGLFTDAHFTPLYAPELTRLMARAIRDSVTGTYNMASTDRVSKYEFGRTLATEFDLPVDLIEPASQSGFGFSAERPEDNSLSVTKAKSDLGMTFPSVAEGLKRMRSDLSQ